ncbi:hypothetical protein [Aquihabitans sp. McL0605]|uniref:hypothetical protein n=1 Tax=Aquihabitans sp. McL0605 TaxID=3415671 RepID=UPI003CF773CC
MKASRSWIEVAIPCALAAVVGAVAGWPFALGAKVVWIVVLLEAVLLVVHVVTAPRAELAIDGKGSKGETGKPDGSPNSSGQVTSEPEPVVPSTRSNPAARPARDPHPPPSATSTSTDRSLGSYSISGNRTLVRRVGQFDLKLTVLHEPLAEIRGPGGSAGAETATGQAPDPSQPEET